MEASAAPEPSGAPLPRESHGRIDDRSGESLRQAAVGPVSIEETPSLRDTTTMLLLGTPSPSANARTCVVGLCTTPFAVAWAWAGLSVELGHAGRVLWTCLLVAWCGALSAPWRRQRGIIRGSALVGVATLIGHAVAAAASPVRVEVWGEGRRPSWSAASILVPERAPTLLAARWVDALGLLPRSERDGMTALISDGYARMADELGTTPSTEPLSFLGFERPSRFHVVRFDHDAGAARPAGVVIFLHGSGGNFTLPCWQLSTMVRERGFSTWCPSLGPAADWASADGVRIIDVTTKAARAEGLSVVLAGLSAGGCGLSERADDVDADAFIYISGISPSVVPSGAPTVVIHGKNDRQVPPPPASTLTAIQAEGVFVDDNHFLMPRRPGHVMQAIHRVLARIDVSR